MSSDLQVAMLTYAIGNYADETVLQNLACENRGVFYRAPDHADLGAIMSKYFLYFALGSRQCTVRWIEYKDWITGTPLMAGCLPFYSPTETAAIAPVRGVSCVDLNMIVPVAQMKEHPHYTEFACQTDFSSRQCAALYLRDCDLAAMRAEAGSTCPSDRSCTASDGYCVDPTCKDNPSFRDSKGYYCDQWVGENCQQAFFLFGYSHEEQDKILQNCPHSCLQCARATHPVNCTDECTGESGNVLCRERITGGDPFAPEPSEKVEAEHLNGQSERSDNSETNGNSDDVGTTVSYCGNFGVTVSLFFLAQSI
jgi:hypothetical protein